MSFRDVDYLAIPYETPYITMHAPHWTGRKKHHARGYVTDRFSLPMNKDTDLVHFCVAFANGLVRELRWVKVPRVRNFVS